MPVEVTGRGTIRTFTVIRVAPEGKQPPYVLALIELEQGPWVMGLLAGREPEEADMGLIGRRVRLISQPVDGLLIAFRGRQDFIPLALIERVSKFLSGT